MADATKTPDADVSPMEAQNEGPAKKGSSDGPLPQAKRSAAEREAEAEGGKVRKGGDDASRDDV